MTPELTFIGTITTPYMTLEECPNNIQVEGPSCHITLYDEYKDGLVGLEVDQHVLILYWLNGADREIFVQQKGSDSPMKGTFALRSPHRPNPIGAAVLPIDKIGSGLVSVRGLDCLNGTQLIDIKPAIYKEVVLES
jgi:tRNA-Thr(GGU) m(6)t(6)A37 methyltransferase TsaA